MMWVGAGILILVGVSGFAVVTTRDVTCQVLALGFYGLITALMFLSFRRRTWPSRRSRWAR